MGPKVSLPAAMVARDRMRTPPGLQFFKCGSPEESRPVQLRQLKLSWARDPSQVETVRKEPLP